MKKLLLPVFIALIISNIAMAQSDLLFSWAKAMGGSDQDIGNSIALDSSGNVYTIGSFYGTVDFDPGSGTFNLTSAGSADIFISKLDVNGNFLWAKAIGGTSYDRGYSIAIDDSGNVYTTGFFQGTSDFNPGVSIFNLTSVGSYEIFISKLDANGNFLWAKAIGGTSHDKGFSIALDDSGNVYTTGYFWGSTDFDPGSGTFILTSAGSGDIFISKLDPNGNFLWAKAMGSSSDDVGNAIAIDATGNVYTAGYFRGTCDFDPGTDIFNLTSAGEDDIFISKLDANGNFLWAKAMGDYITDRCLGITLDPSGSVYTTGYFEGTVDFNSGAGTFNLTSAGSSDIFISKLDANGNFVWAKAMGGSSLELGSSISLDAFGNVYITGDFYETCDFNPSADIFNLTSVGDVDIFISKLDANGNFIWAKSIGGTNGDYAQSLALDASGDVYTTGYFQGTSDFDPGAGTFNLTSVGGDIFIAKYSSIIIDIENIAPQKDIVSIFPNPTFDITYIESYQNVSIDIINLDGQIIEKLIMTGTMEIVDLTKLSGGVYIIKIKTDNGIIVKKLIKQ